LESMKPYPKSLTINIASDTTRHMATIGDSRYNAVAEVVNKLVLALMNENTRRQF
jgi:hypothetical protein